MKTLLFVLLLISHGAALIPFWAACRRKQFPRVCDFATLSVIVYYDLALSLQMAGAEYESPYFSPLISASIDDFASGLLLVSVSPWLLQFGTSIVEGRNSSRLLIDQAVLSELKPQRTLLFYLSAVALLIPTTAYGYSQLQAGSIWAVRAKIGEELGILIVLLYIPLHYLAFFVRHRDSRTLRGRIFLIFLIGCSVISTLGIGQRTNVLLPFLVLILFYFRIRPQTFLVGIPLLIVCSAVLLTTFKWQYMKQTHVVELVQETINGDFARDPILYSAMEQSNVIGAKIFPYSMYGYVYTATFLIPRQLAPFKGVSTGQFFTGTLVGTKPEETNWGFGVGAIEEIILNGGFIAFVPLMVTYGAAMGLLDRLSRKQPAVIVPTRLMALWSFGYHLPGLILSFGVMLGVVIVLTRIFSSYTRE
jgi:hypothetical protein